MRLELSARAEWLLWSLLLAVLLCGAVIVFCGPVIGERDVMALFLSGL